MSRSRLMVFMGAALVGLGARQPFLLPGVVFIFGGALVLALNVVVRDRPR